MNLRALDKPRATTARRSGPSTNRASKETVGKCDRDLARAYHAGGMGVQPPPPSPWQRADTYGPTRPQRSGGRSIRMPRAYKGSYQAGTLSGIEPRRVALRSGRRTMGSKRSSPESARRPSFDSSGLGRQGVREGTTPRSKRSLQQLRADRSSISEAIKAAKAEDESSRAKCTWRLPRRRRGAGPSAVRAEAVASAQLHARAALQPRDACRTCWSEQGAEAMSPSAASLTARG